MLNEDPLGEYILAVGGNEEAARISGVPVAMTKIADLRHLRACWPPSPR